MGQLYNLAIASAALLVWLMKMNTAWLPAVRWKELLAFWSFRRCSHGILSGFVEPAKFYILLCFQTSDELWSLSDRCCVFHISVLWAMQYFILMVQMVKFEIIRTPENCVMKKTAMKIFSFVIVIRLWECLCLPSQARSRGTIYQGFLFAFINSRQYRHTDNAQRKSQAAKTPTRIGVKDIMVT